MARSRGCFFVCARVKAVSADFRPARQPSWVLWMVAAACVAGALALMFSAWQNKRELGRLQNELSSKEGERQAQTMPAQVQPIAPKPYDRSAREMLAERMAPWPDALNALEAAAQIGITPRTVEFNAAEATVRVELVVADPTRLLKYIESLNAGVDKSSNELRWSLQQTQLEPSTNSTTAVIVGSRSGRAMGK
jgi:hypothetical protein